MLAEMEAAALPKDLGPESSSVLHRLLAIQTKLLERIAVPRTLSLR